MMKRNGVTERIEAWFVHRWLDRYDVPRLCRYPGEPAPRAMKPRERFVVLHSYPEELGKPVANES